MKPQRKDERRKDPRFPQNLRVSITQLPSLEGVKGKENIISGYIHNMSQGGLCVITPRALPLSSVVRCEIAVVAAPIRISTLTQVRWTEKQKLHRNKFLSGLSFLI